jgi:transcription factor SPN1
MGEAQSGEDTGGLNKSENRMREVEEQRLSSSDALQNQTSDEGIGEKRKKGKTKDVTVKREKKMSMTMTEKEQPERKKMKKGEIPQAEMYRRVAEFKKYISNAVSVDNRNNKEKKPATEKLRIIDDVVQKLLYKQTQPYFLDANILEILKLWIEPLPDCSLPNYVIRKNILDVLGVLPVKRRHLLGCGIGKIVYFYSKNKKECPDIRNLARGLVQKWTKVALVRGLD